MSATRPRRRPDRTGDPLLERDWELNTIEQSLASAREGRGTVVAVAGPPGSGRSTLLAAAAERASQGGADVLTARAAEAEREFPFGVAIQLLEPAWLAGDARERDALLHGAAAPAAELLAGAPPAAGSPADDYRLVHALHALARNLIALRRGQDAPEALLVAVDDLQWADPESKRFLAYLAERAVELPVVVMVTAAPTTETRRPAHALPAGVHLTLGPLTAPAVGEMVRRRLPEADAATCAGLARITGGNPGLVQAMLDRARQDELSGAADARRVCDLVPAAVVDEVRRRLGRVPAAARAVAIAAAVLDDEASLVAVGELASLPAEELLAVAEELAAAGLLAGESPPLSFAQPLVRVALLAGLAPSERAHAHAGAASVLAGHARDAATVAPHLMAVPPGSDSGVLRLLRRFAITARADGDSGLAISLVERALLHQPPPEQRSELLIELALAEGEEGLPTVALRLAAAKRLTADPRRAAKIALLEAQTNCGERNYRQAAAILEPLLDSLDAENDDLRRRAAVAFVAAAALVPDLRSRALRVRDDALTGLAQPATPADAVALAHTVLLDAVDGETPATVRARAELAWGGGALLEAAAPRDPAVPTLLISLMAVDELEAAEEILRHVGGLPARTGAWLDGGLRPLQAWCLYLRGEIAAADAEARRSAQAHPRHWPLHTAAALAVGACCQIQRGDLAGAEAALKTMSLHAAADEALAPARLAIRAELRLAQHRPQDALHDALRAGEGFAEVFPGADLAVVPWRSTAACAHLMLGRAGEALALIEPDLEAARRLGLARQAMRALRLKGLALGGEEGLSLLREAVELGDGAGPRLERVQALIDLGAALRRANRRTAARAPLTRGLDLADRGGATALAARAHAELMASGARPRRRALSGIESLTASQRRVADLAAQGLTTRQIAEALFVTPKTVEFHLRSIYQKLDVASRSALTELFAAA